MRTMLRPKVLLFFAISIMSFYITSETSYALDADHDRSTSSSSTNYVEMGKDALLWMAQYSYHVLVRSYNFISLLCVSKSKDDVKIQIKGPAKEEQDRDDGTLCTQDDRNDEQGDHCKPGDNVCQNNMDYFNNAFILAKLGNDGAGSQEVDMFDIKYCGYAQAEQKLLYEDTDAINNNDAVDENRNDFDAIKKHYEAIDYEDLV